MDTKENFSQMMQYCTNDEVNKLQRFFSMKTLIEQHFDEIIPEPLEDISYMWSLDVWDFRLMVCVPWDTVLCDKICLAFQEKGWVLQRVEDLTTSSKSKYFYYTHPLLGEKFDMKVSISMNASREGSKCRVEPIKETVTVEKVTWKVICEDMLNV